VIASNSHEVKIILVSFFMCLSFFISFHGYIKNNGSYYPETPTALAYSVYQYNSFSHYKAGVYYKDGVIINQENVASSKIPIFEHPGYGWLMGLAWKVTGSLKYYDMQIVQMLLFVFSCLLLYWGLFAALLDSQKALWAACLVPLFFPLLFLNVNPIRDIYCFYGAAVLFYLFSYAYYKELSIKQMTTGGLFIALCQWMRPTIFGSLVLGFCFIMGYSYFYKREKFLNICLLGSILAVTNGIGFWAPWTLFNKQVHGRYFAAPSGQQLLDSMGWTGPNKINPDCPDTNNGLYCDGCVTQYTVKRFNLDTTKTKVGTSAMDDKMGEAFWEWFCQDPIFWVKGFLWRIKKVLLLDLTWSTTYGWNWKYYNSFSKYSDRLNAAYSFGFYNLLEFLFRRWFVRVFMILGYFGALCLIYEQKFFLLGLLISLTAGGIAPAIISHAEHRYLTPFYFIYPLLAGYFLYIFCLNIGVVWFRLFSKKRIYMDIL
jgi:hypothetical protein